MRVFNRGANNNTFKLIPKLIASTGAGTNTKFAKIQEMKWTEVTPKEDI